ncbi:MAG: hypothetical protein QM608_04505, partial [Caulobacter sp.]
AGVGWAKSSSWARLRSTAMWFSDRGAAAAGLLNHLAVDRKRALLDDLAQPTPAAAMDAVDLVREGRDGR